MRSSDTGARNPPREQAVVRGIALVVGLGFVVPGVWAMIDPRSFFDVLATFPPYNQHFIQDIGAFQIGLGAVLLVAGARPRSGGLIVGLLGVGVGAALHTVSHVLGRELGGNPQTDIPTFAIMAVLLLGAAWLGSRAERSRAP